MWGQVGCCLGDIKAQDPEAFPVDQSGLRRGEPSAAMLKSCPGEVSGSGGAGSARAGSRGARGRAAGAGAAARGRGPDQVAVLRIGSLKQKQKLVQWLLEGVWLHRLSVPGDRKLSEVRAPRIPRAAICSSEPAGGRRTPPPGPAGRGPGGLKMRMGGL